MQVDTQRNRIIATAALKKAEPLADQGMNIPQSLVCLDAGRQKLNNQLSIGIMFLKHTCMLLLLQIVYAHLDNQIGKLAEAKQVLKDAIATLEGSVAAQSDYCKVRLQHSEGMYVVVTEIHTAKTKWLF